VGSIEDALAHDAVSDSSDDASADGDAVGNSSDDSSVNDGAENQSGGIEDVSDDTVYDKTDDASSDDGAGDQPGSIEVDASDDDVGVKADRIDDDFDDNGDEDQAADILAVLENVDEGHLREGRASSQEKTCSYSGCAGSPTVATCSSKDCSGLACHLCSIKADPKKADEGQSWRICAACLAKPPNQKKFEAMPARKGRQFIKTTGPVRWLGNPNVMCYLNQALCALCYSGSWWARTLDYRTSDVVWELDDGIGESIIGILCFLQQPSLDEAGHLQMEEDRDYLAAQLYPGEDASVRQQDLLECMHRMLEHIDGNDTAIEKLELRTCNFCGVSSSPIATKEHMF
jgi:hypothetical protein